MHNFWTANLLKCIPIPKLSWTENILYLVLICLKISIMHIYLLFYYILFYKNSKQQEHVKFSNVFQVYENVNRCTMTKSLGSPTLIKFVVKWQKPWIYCSLIYFSIKNQYYISVVVISVFSFSINIIFYILDFCYLLINLPDHWKQIRQHYFLYPRHYYKNVQKGFRFWQLKNKTLKCIIGIS